MVARKRKEEHGLQLQVAMELGSITPCMRIAYSAGALAATVERAGVGFQEHAGLD